ncbi:hypothetical protein ACI65C_006490 [Semiaphis heraclei]
MDESICPAWSDDVEPEKMAISSLKIISGFIPVKFFTSRFGTSRFTPPSRILHSSDDIPKRVKQEENVYEFFLPPEVMEKIVCYFDCDTLIKFKHLSNASNEIANNALLYNKQWKKICHLEIPKKYLIDLFTKQLDNKIPFDLLSNNHYETAYKNWHQWQSPVFKLSFIKQYNFLGVFGKVKIICHKRNTMVVFTNFMFLFSITKNQNTGDYDLKNIDMENCESNGLLVLNPRPETNPETGEDNIFIYCNENHSNVCPLHNTMHDGKNREECTENLIDVDMNFYTNTCCWVQNGYYEWHSDIDSKINKSHSCPHLIVHFVTSVVHGLIISRYEHNSIVIHGIRKNLCIGVNPWLKKKHAGASAIYLYINILFIGTMNGFLLAYRLNSMDDLINLKDKNILFEEQLQIGPITTFDIMDFEDVKAIVVSSITSVFWYKIN